MEEKTAGRGFLILSIAGILGKILAAIYAPLLIRIIGNDGYGIYSVGYDIFIFLFAITTLGAQPAITKVVTELKVLGNHKDALRAMKIARKYLTIIGVIISIFFMIIAYPLANITGNERSALSFMFLAPAIIFAAILAAYRGYMQGIEDMESLAISSVVEQLVNVVLSLVFAFVLFNISVEWGSAGGTIGTSLGAIVAIVYIMYVFEKRGYEDQAFSLDKSTKRVSDKKIIRKLIKYGLPITLVAGIQNASGLVDAMTIKNRLEFAGILEKNVLDAMYGILTQYKTLIYVPLTIVTALGTSIFPRVIQAFIQKDKKELKRQMSYSFRLTYIITIPATFGLAILSREIYIFLFGKETGYELLMFGSSALILMSITTIQNVILQGINKFYLIMATAIMGLFAKFIINYLLIGITNINIKGAVVGTFVAFAIPAVINHIELQKIFKIKIPIIKQAIVPLISSSIMSFVIILIKMPLNRLFSIIGVEGNIVTAIITIILITLGGLVYLVVMIYFGGIRKYDLDMISPRLYRLMPRRLRKQLG